MQKDVTRGWEEHDLQYILFQLAVVFPTLNSSRILKSSKNFTQNEKDTMNTQNWVKTSSKFFKQIPDAQIPLESSFCGFIYISYY